MDTLLVISLVAWMIVIPWILAVWFSPVALLWIRKRITARADGLTAGNAAYKLAHDAAMGINVERYRDPIEYHKAVTARVHRDFAEREATH